MNKTTIKRLLVLSCLLISIVLFGCQCEHKIKTVATCTEPSVCESCGQVFTEPVGHNYTSSITAIATCTQEGIVTYVCENCGDTYSLSVPKLNHVGKEKVVVNPTLNKVGENQITCEICKEVVTEKIPPLGNSKNEAYEMKASDLYSDICNGKGVQYQTKYLKVIGKVTYISDYGDLKGYYLYGSIGEGVVCWVDGNSFVANTGSKVEFVGFVQTLGVNHIELTECTLVNEIEVKEEPGLTIETAIELKLSDISAKHVNRWVSFSGSIEQVIPYGDETWYYLKNDVVCLSSESHQIGDTVRFIGKVISDGDLWVSIIDCQSR